MSNRLFRLVTIQFEQTDFEHLAYFWAIKTINLLYTYKFHIYPHEMNLNICMIGQKLKMDNFRYLNSNRLYIALWRIEKHIFKHDCEQISW